MRFQDALALVLAVPPGPKPSAPVFAHPIIAFCCRILYLRKLAVSTQSLLGCGASVGLQLFEFASALRGKLVCRPPASDTPTSDGVL